MKDCYNIYENHVEYSTPQIVDCLTMLTPQLRPILGDSHAETDSAQN